MKLIRSLFDRRALLPAAALLILSGVYELGYYAIFALPLPAVGQGALFIVWYLAAGVALYCLMTAAWHRNRDQSSPAAVKSGRRKAPKASEPELTVSGALRSLALAAFYLVLVYGILRPLYGLAASHSWVLVPVELLCALVLIFCGPLTVIWNQAAACRQRPWQLLSGLWKRRSLVNGWCFIVLVRMALDTLLGGLFTLAFGLNAFSLSTLMLFQGDPLSSAALYASGGFAGAALLFCLTGCLYAWMMAGWFLHGTE